MRKLLNMSLDALAYAAFCGLVMLVIWYVTPEKARAHEPYSTWKIPGSQTSCCSGYDCGPAQASYRDGTWWVNILGVWVQVPDERVLRDVSSPDGNAHVCYNGRVLCFMPPEAKS
jgi:hypothetical protein